MLKVLFVVAGFICAGLGTVGIFVPVLPTVPFYILAALCFAKGSARFYCWFTSTSLYRKHVESFEKNRSMTLRTKFSILIPVTIMLIPTAIVVDVLAMRVVIAILLLVKYWYFIFKIKTIDSASQICKPL